jgi:hypothetical protein
VAGRCDAVTTIGIVDLVELCDEQCATHLGWFVALGERVRDERDPRRQRWCGEAAHRHAWHAELWAQRRPSIPHDAVHELPPPRSIDVGDDLAAAYRAHVDEQRSLFDRLRRDIDPELDPSTARVITLVATDLDDLAATLG